MSAEDRVRGLLETATQEIPHCDCPRGHGYGCPNYGQEARWWRRDAARERFMGASLETAGLLLGALGLLRASAECDERCGTLLPWDDCSHSRIRDYLRHAEAELEKIAGG